jgi:hypothetical protein
MGQKCSKLFAIPVLRTPQLLYYHRVHVERTGCLESVALWGLGIYRVIPSAGQFQRVVDGRCVVLEVMQCSDESTNASCYIGSYLISESFSGC